MFKENKVLNKMIRGSSKDNKIRLLDGRVDLPSKLKTGKKILSEASTMTTKTMNISRYKDQDLKKKTILPERSDKIVYKVSSRS